MFGIKKRKQTSEKCWFEPIVEESQQNWIHGVEVNGQKVEILNFGIDMPRGYTVGFAVNGEVLEKISTGSAKFMRLVGRNASNLVTHTEFINHLGIWGNKMIDKYRIDEQKPE